MGTARHSDFEMYRRLLVQARPYWLHIAGILALDLVSTPLALLTPLPLKIAVDSFVGSHPLPGVLDALLPAIVPRSDSTVLTLAVGLLVGVAVLNQIQELAVSLLRTYTSEKLILGFRALLFRHVQRLSLSYHDSTGTADSTYRVQWDAPSIEYIVIDSVIPSVTAAFTFAMVIFVTVQLDWQLAGVAVVVVPALVVVTQAIRIHLRKRYTELKNLETSALAVIQEVLTSIRVVKAFGQEEREQERFVHRSSQSMRARIGLALFEGGFFSFVSLATTLGTAAVLFIGMRHVQSGVLTLGELLLVMTYVSQLYAPLRIIVQTISSMQDHLASAERAFTLLDQATEVAERPHPRPIGRAAGSVTFRNVSFAYEDEKPVLQDISFEITPGARLGIAGTTGAGKTTLVNLLSRFYDPSQGQILLDGLDLRDYKLVDLRNQFGFVLQDPVLFSSSIAENIAYSRPNASEDEIVAAANAACAHDFITRLPHGYDTLVGERGMRLSGGERQRISLARAFLKDAPILILDEPTSSVDMKTEGAIMEAMERLMHDRTTIMIAHRLSTLANCDMRIEIEDGRVREGALP
ncbi:MAG: Xenobiotic-transporting ATPase, partial [Chloroflexi bacterium]|nr:Xenobiotic-transporting ATPase [Chloroflexota bacterium]